MIGKKKGIIGQEERETYGKEGREKDEVKIVHLLFFDGRNVEWKEWSKIDGRNWVARRIVAVVAINPHPQSQ